MRRLKLISGFALSAALALVLIFASPSGAEWLEYNCLVKGRIKGGFKTQRDNAAGQGGAVIFFGRFAARADGLTLKSRTRTECLNNEYLTPLEVTGLIEGAEQPIVDIHLKLMEPGPEPAEIADIPEGRPVGLKVRRATVCDLTLFHLFRNKQFKPDRPQSLDLLWTRKGCLVVGCLLEPAGRTNGLQSYTLTQRGRVLARIEVDDQGRVIRLNWPGELTFVLKNPG